jgi:hypothetical protein
MAAQLLSGSVGWWRLTRAGLCVALLLGLCPSLASATPGEPTILALSGQQSAPLFVDGGIVFVHQSVNDGQKDLWVKRDGEAASVLASGAGDQHLAAAWGRYVVFVDTQLDGQQFSFRIDVADTVTGEIAVVVAASSIGKAALSVYEGVLVWEHGPYNDRDVYCAVLDGNGNGRPDVLEGLPAPTVTPLVQGAADAYSPALGPNGLTFAEKDATGYARIRHIDDLDTPGAVRTLSTDTGNKQPAPQAAGDLAVWRESGGIAIHCFSSDDTVSASSGAGWGMHLSPATDGENVAWAAVSTSDGSLSQVFIRGTGGSVARLNPTATRQAEPAFGPGILAWTDSRLIPGSGAPNIALITLDESILQVVTIAGTNRYATAVQASEEAYPDGTDTVVIATGRNWPDALGGSALAGALDAPILLVPGASVPDIVTAEIERLGATSAVIVGGELAVGPGVFSALQRSSVPATSSGYQVPTATRPQRKSPFARSRCSKRVPDTTVPRSWRPAGPMPTR